MLRNLLRNHDKIVELLVDEYGLMSEEQARDLLDASLNPFEVNCVPYFFGYKTRVCLVPKQSKNIDLSYKMDLDLWDCLGRVKLVIADFHRTDFIICSHSREGRYPSYS